MSSNVVNQIDSSEIVKPHTGLAAAISRILCENQTGTLGTKTSKVADMDGYLAQTCQPLIEVVQRLKIQKNRDTISPSTRKRNYSLLTGSDSEENVSLEGGDSKARTLQSELIKACHRLPEESSLEDEKRLHRLATKGVVQLFNAVSKHQKSLEEKLKEAGSSERKKLKVLSSVDKGEFIKMLKGTDGREEVRSSSEPTWSILKDDYLKNAELQNWDKTDSVLNSDYSSDD